jgi:hypothetical protein
VLLSWACSCQLLATVKSHHSLSPFVGIVDHTLISGAAALVALVLTGGHHASRSTIATLRASNRCAMSRPLLFSMSGWDDVRLRLAINAKRHPLRRCSSHLVYSSFSGSTRQFTIETNDEGDKHEVLLKSLEPRLVSKLKRLTCDSLVLRQADLHKRPSQDVELWGREAWKPRGTGALRRCSVLIRSTQTQTAGAASL